MAERPNDFRAFRRRLDRVARELEGNRARLEDLQQELYRRHPEENNEDSTDSNDEEELMELDGVSDNSEEDRGGRGDDDDMEENRSDISLNGSDRDGNRSDADEDHENENHSDENQHDEESDDEVHDHEDDSESDPNSGDNHDSDGDNNNGENHNNDVVFANDDERDAYCVDGIRTWALQGGVLSMRKLDKLLRVLHPLHPTLPVSYKSLLRTPINVQVINVQGGNLWYKGIRENLVHLDLNEYLRSFNEIKIDVNMDGLPLFKRSKVKFWPILGKLVGTKNHPFIIAIFRGRKDPEVHEFLTDFADEVRDLQNNGFTYNGSVFVFNVRHYICDAPARAKVKCIIEHGGACACEKCVVVGEWLDNRMTYLVLDAPLRTDESFLNQQQARHHHGESPLEQTVWGPVSQFRLDCLHLVHLGAYKRLWGVWRKWNGPWKLRWRDIDVISNRMEELIPSCPSDFNRPPRSLLEIALFNAIEFRRSLLYEGPLVLRNTLDKNAYDHFLLLHCGIYILSSSVLCREMNHIADYLLRLFISHGAVIYGAKFVVYNIHNLSHLSAECEAHGALESFSAYPYENKLKSIKQSLKSGFKPLKQAANRDLERTVTEVILDRHDNQVTLARTHHILDEIIEGNHYQYLRVNDTVFKTNVRDSCFKTTDGNVVILKNIVARDQEIFFVGQRFAVYGNVYEYPMPSSDLGIVSVAELSEERMAYPLNEVHAKCWLMPDGDGFFVVFKFIDNEEDDDEVLYDVGLESWLIDINQEMKGKIKWPPCEAGKLVRKEAPPQPEWKTYNCFVKRFYDTYVNAVAGMKRRIDDTNYETDSQQVKRVRRRPTRFLSDDEAANDSTDDDAARHKRVKKSNSTPAAAKKSKQVPPPPVVILPGRNKDTSPLRTQMNNFNVTVSKTISGATRDKSKFLISQKPKTVSILRVPKKTSGAEVLKQRREAIWSALKSSEVAGEEEDKRKKLLQKIQLHEAHQKSGSGKKKEQESVNFNDDSSGDMGLTDDENDKVIEDLVTPIADVVDIDSLGSMNNDNVEQTLCEKSTVSHTSLDDNIVDQAMESFSDNVNEKSPLIEKSGSPVSRYLPNRSTSRYLEENVNSVGDNEFSTAAGSDVSGDRFHEILQLLKENKVEIRRMNSKIDVLSWNVDKLSRFLLPGEKFVKRPQGLPAFPVQTMRELKDMERFLEDDSNLSTASMFLGKYVFKEDLEKSTRALLRKIVGKAVAQNFTFTGKNNNKSFGDLNLWRLIEGALLTTFESGKVAEAPSIASRWLTLYKYSPKEAQRESNNAGQTNSSGVGTQRKRLVNKGSKPSK